MEKLSSVMAEALSLGSWPSKNEIIVSHISNTHLFGTYYQLDFEIFESQLS